jgi:hypothetical protein
VAWQAEGYKIKDSSTRTMIRLNFYLAVAKLCGNGPEPYCFFDYVAASVYKDLLFMFSINKI